MIIMMSSQVCRVFSAKIIIAFVAKRVMTMLQNIRCNNPCASCHHVHEDGVETPIHCEDCNRYFRNNHCFDRHKMTTQSGKSTCKTHYKCKICSQLINTNMHNKPHKFRESYCRTCRDFFDENHKCYMIPVSGHTDVPKDKSFEDDSCVG